MAFSLAGCGLFGVKNELPPDISEPKQEEPAASTETSKEEAKEEATNERAPFTNEGLILVSPERYSTESLYVFETDGSLVDQFDIEAITKELMENGDAQNYTYQAYGDGILFFTGYKYEDGENYYDLVAYDTSSKEITDVIYWGSDNFYDIEVYDGKLNLSVYHEFNDWSVKCFEKDENALAFKEATPKYSDIYQQIGNYNISYIERNCCLDHYLDKNGAIVARLDDSFYLIKTDGSIKENTFVKTNMSSMYGDDKYVLFHEFDDSYETIGLFAMNLENGEKTQIAGKDATVIAFEDGVLYYIDREKLEFEVYNDKITSYNTATGETTVLFEKKTIPGTEMYSAIATGFTLGGGKAFYTDFKDGKVEILYADVIDGKFENEQETGLFVQTFSAYEYGTAEYKTIASYCENCGIPLTEAYAEIFTLDPKYSDKAAEINGAIREASEAFLSNYAEQPESWLGDYGGDCEDHKAYPQQYDMTDSSMIDEVGIIEDRYLFINKSGYWYGGGAHGMPSRDQMLFDLTTGQELKLSDFYKGSEEDYKTLVATKTREDYESYGTEKGASPYFADNAQDVYDQAYESVHLDMNVYFADGGIIYYFYPYDMGSYADGFRDIFISYEDLLGRNTLSE